MAKFFRTPFAAVGDREEIPDETQGTGAVSYPEGFGFDYERDPATDPAAKRVPRKQTNQYLYDITDNLRQYQLFGSPEWVPASENGGEPVVYAANARVLFDGKLYRALQMTSAQPGVGDTWREEEPFNLAALRASTAQAQAGTDNATLMTPLRVKEAIAAQTTTLTPAQILAALLTVDGPGSGLDADLLDGYHASAFARLTGATFTGSISMAPGHGFQLDGKPALAGTGTATWLYSIGVGGFAFRNSSNSTSLLTLTDAGSFHRLGNLIWDAGNDGAGSGLDADLLDGQHGSYYANIPARLGYTPANKAGDTFTGSVSVQGALLMGASGLSRPGVPAGSAIIVDGGGNWYIRNGSDVFRVSNADGSTNFLYVTAASLTTSGAVTTGGNLYLPNGAGLYSNGRVIAREASGGTWLYSAGANGFTIRNDTNSLTLLTINNSTGMISRLGNTVWDAGNDGSGSGLDADLLDGLHGSAYVKTADFSQSLTLSGYCKLPNGVIMQWGRFTAAVDTTTSVNFPTVFPNFCGGVTVSGTYNWSGTAEDNAPNVKSGSVLPNKFEVWNAENSSVTVYYVALGY